MKREDEEALCIALGIGWFFAILFISAYLIGNT